MKKPILISFFLMAVAVGLFTGTGCSPKCPPCATCLPVCESFDGMPPAQYGNVGGTVVNPPGSTVFSIAAGIPVRIDMLTPGTFYGFAAFEPAPASFGAGQVINTNNVTLEFDFTGKNIKQVSIEFLDMGGNNNLSINGAMYAGKLATAPPSLGGAGVTVTTAPIPGGLKGKVTATGSINTFRIGGMEFHLDNLCFAN